jgi:hypothetical protein
MNTKQKEQIWSNLKDTKYKSFILGFLIDKYQRKERRTNVFLVFTSSGSIAVWAVWDFLPLLWSGIIASSQLVTVMKPLFPFSKYIKEFNKKYIQSQSLVMEFEKLFYKIRNNLIDDAVAVEFFFDLRKQQNEIFNFSEETIIDVSEKIKYKANLKMKNYLKRNYQININVEPFKKK